MAEWLDAQQLSIASILTMIAVTAVALWVLRFVRRIMGRVIVVGIALILVGSLYVQRADLLECQQTCSCSLYGRVLDVPEGVWCGPDDAARDGVNGHDASSD